MALVVIAIVYSKHVTMRPLIFALVFFAMLLVVRRAARAHRPRLLRRRGRHLGSLFYSGIDPVVIGLVMGLLTFAYAP